MFMPDNKIIYAIGDIHGCPWLLTSVIDWIGEHAKAHETAQKLIIILGDAIDRGPDSRGVIDQLLQGPPDGFEMICLRGNHEDMMLRVLETGTGLSIWAQNGGISALRNYGIDNIEPLRQSSPAVIRQTLCAAVPLEHQKFLSDTTLSHQEGGYLFVHAGIRPGIPLNRQSPEDMMWIRHDFTHSPDDFGSTVVHGHTVSREPDERTNAIGLDTGAVMTGRLSCVALWQEQRQFFSTPTAQAC